MLLVFDDREEQKSVDSDSISSASSDTDYPVGTSYMPRCDYATSIQQNREFVGYREEIYEWLLKNSDKLHCPRCAVFRAANYVDRVLSVIRVQPELLEGLSWLCFYLADSIGDLRNRKLSYKSVCDYFSESYRYSSAQVLSFIQHILQILGFRLLTSCPYTYCYHLLETSGHPELFDKAVLLIDSICKKYVCISLSVRTIATAVLQVLSQLEYNNPVLVDSLGSRCEVDQSGIELCLNCIKSSYPRLLSSVRH